MPGRVVLQTGWNLFGPGTDVPLPPSTNLQGSIWWWNTVANMYSMQVDGENLLRGRGYWVYAKIPVVLEY